MRIEGSLTINRPVKDVWEFMQDSSNGHKYEKTLVSEKYLGDGPRAVGTKMERVTKMMGKTARNTFELTEFEEHKKLTWKPLEGPMPLDGGFTWEAAGEGTKFGYWFQTNPKGFEKVIEFIFSPMIRGGINGSFKKMKAVVESEGKASS